MRDMIYQSSWLNPPEQIANGEYKGFNYYVLNLGTHPCAYVDVTETKLKNADYDSIDIECHGGLTYSSEHLRTVDKKGWFIGWDYAHAGDYAGYNIKYPFITFPGRKWTTQEIVDECKEVIDQLVELLKGGNDMAEKEYIEREAALKILENSLTFCKRELYKGSFRQGCIAATQDDIGNIKHIPTADVAPRAEVDRLRELNNFLIEARQEWQKRYENLAREIFEEIEENYADFLFDGYRNIVVLTEKDFNELKKKYTDGEDTNVPTKKDYYTPEEVRNMSHAEISNNLTVIRESMKRWREK